MVTLLGTVITGETLFINSKGLDLSVAEISVYVKFVIGLSFPGLKINPSAMRRMNATFRKEHFNKTKDPAFDDDASTKLMNSSNYQLRMYYDKTGADLENHAKLAEVNRGLYVF